MSTPTKPEPALALDPDTTPDVSVEIARDADADCAPLDVVTDPDAAHERLVYIEALLLVSALAQGFHGGSG